MPFRCRTLLAAVLGAAVTFSLDNALAQQKIDTCRDGKADAKISACTDLIKRGRGELDIYYHNRSIAWEEKGECDLALSDAEKAVSLKRHEDNFIRLGLVLTDCKGLIDEAITRYSDGIKVLPKSAVLYLARAAALTKNAEFERAQADFEQSLRLDPRDAEAWQRRGSMWASQEDWDKAIKAQADLERALKLEPKNADHYDIRAGLYRDIGDYERALADHDRAIALQPSSLYYSGRAKTFMLKGDLDRALADANEAVKREAGTVWALFRRGTIYRYRGEYDRSLADYDQLLRRYPYDAATYVERGRTYEKKGDLVRARADFERALKERGSQFKKAHEDASAQLAALGAGAIHETRPTGPSAAATPVSQPVSPAPSAPQAVTQRQEHRVALVIGNSDYAHTPKLSNPVRDAQAVAASLRTIGFQTVTVGNDMTRDKLIAALRGFVREAEKADWAMVYYAGHGIEVGGVNYLIPVDARLETDRDTSFEAVSLDQVLTAVESARKIKLVVLDACRDNPFAAQMRRTTATRSIGRGLSRIEPEGATLVVYAAKHGQIALDGTGANSPFAAALVKRMAAPGVEINKVFRLIRDDVMEATAGRQEPFTYGSLPGREDFFFVAK
jgi:tetratricopeptide (TPR) repeat protein